MTWIVDARPDQSSRALVRKLCSADETLCLVAQPDPSELGVLICSEQSRWPDVRDLISAAAGDGAQLIALHLGNSISPWHELAAGAVDVLRWDGNAETIQAKIARFCEVERVANSAAVTAHIIGSSYPLRQALRELITAARFGSGPVLILGETGTGKELAAQVAHLADPARAKGPLVVLDCTTIVPGLLGSELFGHERGAFTGAVAARSGACAAADGGVLFLDEIGELPLNLQPEFLRVIQEGAYKHVGGDRWQHSSFRLICATNRDLSRELDEGRFRSDLYYRIASSVVRMPPLRERGSDIVELFTYFYEQARGAGGSAVSIDDLVRQAICDREYSGNLRDLRQLAYRVAARHVGVGAISPGDLPEQDRPAVDGEADVDVDATSALDESSLAHAVQQAVAAGTTLRQLREQVTQFAVDAALAESGSVRGAAQRLGVTDRALHLRRANSREGATKQ